MNIVEKFKELIEFQNINYDEKIEDLNPPISEQEILNIEKLLNEPLTKEFEELYYFANGQSENDKGVLFGYKFISAIEVLSQLEFSLTLVKPENKFIENKELSDKLLNKIVAFYIEGVAKYELLKFEKNWHKIEFTCGLLSYGGPYIYSKEDTNSEEREILKIEDYNAVSPIIKELHEVEKRTYNWDELEFVLYSNGKFDCKRTFYDFDNRITFTSTPDNAIKKKYFHYKWLPVFSDYCGNYIGIDLDPDSKGTKGQIINFGRDEENMVVLAKSLERFFDFLLIETQKPESNLLNLDYHLHDTLKELKK